MVKVDNVTHIRKTLLANGYTPLPAKGKQCLLKFWPTIEITDKVIDGWRRSGLKTTGVRLKGIFVDRDVLDRDAGIAIVNAWMDAFPALFDDMDVPLLERCNTANDKGAYFFRLAEGEEAFGHIHTALYRAPGASPESPAHRVEVFGGRSPRFVGLFGPHGRAPDGTVTSEYRWPAETLLEVPYDQLPAMTKAQAGELCDIAAKVMEGLGFTKVEGSSAGQHNGDWVYTITDDAIFQCADGVDRNLEDMKLASIGDAGMRCSASFIEPGASNRSRCLARTDGDRFYVTDFDTYDKHQELSAKPEPILDLNTLLPEIKKLGEKLPPTGVPGCAKLMAAVIRRDYAYMPTAQKPVVPIYGGGGAKPMINFRLEMLPWKEEVLGPRQGIRKISPVDLWLGDPGRTVVAGHALRPDLPEGVYSVAGVNWINNYRAPVHDAVGGSSALLVDFGQRLIPSAMEYRYIMQCIAHKYRHPEVPGPGIVMVAPDKFGTGRGLFAKLLEKVFSSRYVKTIQYDTFAGQTYQSQYNGYEAENVIVVIDEAQQAHGHKRGSKDDGGAKIRDRMSPNARVREIIEKGVPARYVMVYVTYVVMSNNYDTFRIYEQERRCIIATNGEVQEPAFYEAVAASIDNPADVADFVRHLLTIDLSDFNPYAPPPMTDAKRVMVSTSESDIDRGFDAVIEHMRGKAEVFTMHHVLNGMSAIERAHDLEYHPGWKQHVRRNVSMSFKRVGIERNYQLEYKALRTTVFAWTKEAADRWAKADRVVLLKELLKLGPLDNGFGSTLVRMDTSAFDDGVEVVDAVGDPIGEA